MHTVEQALDNLGHAVLVMHMQAHGAYTIELLKESGNPEYEHGRADAYKSVTAMIDKYKSILKDVEAE